MCDSPHPTSQNCAELSSGSIYAFSKISDLTCPRPTPPAPPIYEPVRCCSGKNCPNPRPTPHSGGDVPDAGGKPESDTGSKFLIAIVAAVIGLGVGMLVGAKCLRGSKMDSLLDSHLNNQIDGSE